MAGGYLEHVSFMLLLRKTKMFLIAFICIKTYELSPFTIFGCDGLVTKNVKNTALICLH